MHFETLQAEVDGPVGTLTLNRPKILNALNATVLNELEKAARWFDEQSDLRVVTIRGKGRAFCAGADLKDSTLSRATPHTQTPWLDRREAGRLGSKMAAAIENMRATTIAQVHGYCIGGGVVIVSACDLRVAAADAVFVIPEVDLGIPLTWGGIPRLVRDIGPAMTKELVMTCREFRAAEAKEIGFINRVVPANELQSHVDALAKEIAQKPSVPVAITKAHVNAVATSMVGQTAYADGDILLGSAADPESQKAAAEYRRRLEEQKSQG